MNRVMIRRARVGVVLTVLAVALAGAAAAGCSGETAPTSTAAPVASGPQTTSAAPQTTLTPATPASPTPSAPTSAPPVTSAPASEYVTVDVQQTYEALNANEAAQIVDVREPGEWATTGVPPRAVLIPLGQLEQRAPGELAKDKPVYVICNSGNRSRTASDILLNLGYTEVYNVGGGIQAWLRAGLPVDTYTP